MKSFAILAIAAILHTTTVKAEGTSLIDWEKHVYDDAETLKDIPDLIKMNDVRFYFKVTNWFMTGIERGLYNDTSLIINSDCFGDQFVTMINQF